MIESFRSRFAVRGIFGRLLGKLHIGQAKRRRSRLVSRAIERLEDRLLLAYDVNLTAGGILTVSQADAGDTSALNISLSGGGTYTFADAGIMFNAATGGGAGNITNNGNDFTVSNANVSSIVVTTGDGNDVITITGFGQTGDDISINAGGDGGDTITVGGAFTSDGDVSFTNTNAINVNQAITTTTSGLVTLNAAGAVTIAAAGDISADGAVSITGGGGISTAGDVTTTADNVTYNSATTLTGNVAVNSAGGAIQFSNTLDGAFTLGLTAGAGNVTFTGVVGGATPLGAVTIVSANNVTATTFSAASLGQTAGTGTTTLNGAVSTTAAAGVNINTTNIALNNTITTTGNGIVTLNASGTNTIAAAGDISADGAVSITGGGGISTAGDVTTTNDNVTYNSATVLTGSIVIDTATGGAETIQFSSTLNGTTDFTEDLTITAGSGNINFVGVVGGAIDLGDVLINNAANVTASAAFNSDTLTQTTGTGLTTLSGGAINRNATVTNNAITLQTATLTTNAGFDGATTFTALGGAININAGLDATAATILLDAQGDDQSINIAAATTVQTTDGGATAIQYRADKMALSATSVTTVGASGGRIILQPNLTADSDDGMNLGSATNAVADTLELSDAEIETLVTTAGVVQLGTSGMTGAIVVSVVGFGDDDADGFSTMHLFTGNTDTTFGSEAVRDTSGIVQANLAITSVGSVNLDGTNDVDNLAAAITGAGAEFHFNDIDDLDIDTVDGVVGISTNNGDVTLQTGGALTQAQPITTGTADLRVLGTGPVTLNNASNNVTTLAFSITGATNAFQYTDANTLTIGSVVTNSGTTNGGTTNNGNITVVVTTGGLTVAATAATPDVSSTGGNIILTANGNDQMLTIASGATVGSANGYISYLGDKMNLVGTTDSGSGRILLTAANNGDGVDMGSTTDAAANTLEISDAEISTLTTTGVVQIGGDNTGTVAGDGGNGNSTGTPTMTGNFVVTVLNFGSATFPTLAIFAGGGTVTDTSGIVQQNLRIESIGSVTLDGNNDVDNLSARVTGNGSTFRFDDDDNLNVTTVDTVAGVQTTNAAGVNNIAINAAETTAGALTILQSVIASASGNILLRTITAGAASDIDLQATVIALGDQVVLRSADDVTDTLNDRTDGTVRASTGLFVAANEMGDSGSSPSLSTNINQVAGQVTTGTGAGTPGFFLEEATNGTTLTVDSVTDFSDATYTPGGGLGTINGVTTANGSPIEIRTRAGTLTVNQQVTVNGTTNNGSILLVAGGAASNIVTNNSSGDVTTNDTTNLPSAGITMIAGNDITIGDTVTSSGGTIHFITGQANSDTYSTTATGNVNSTNGLIVINANAVANAAGAQINSGTANTVVRPNAATHSIDIGGADAAGVIGLSQQDIDAFATTGAGVLIIGSSTDAASTPHTGTAVVTTFPTSADPVTGGDGQNGGEFDTTGITHTTGDVNFRSDVTNVTLISHGAIGATVTDADLILSGSTTGVFTLDSRTGISGLSGSANAITGTANDTKLSVDAAIVAARTRVSGNILLHFPSTQGLAIGDATLDPTYSPLTNITTVIGRSTGLATNFNGVTTAGASNGSIDLEVDDNNVSNRTLVTRQPVTADGSGNITVTALNDGIVQMVTGTAQTVSQTNALPVSNSGNWSTGSGNITTLHGADATPDTTATVTQNVFKMAGLTTSKTVAPGDVFINFHSNVVDNNTGATNITGDALTITDLTDNGSGMKLANFGVGGDNIELDVNSITVTGGVIGSFVITSVAGDLHVAQTTTQNGPFSVTLLGANATLFLDGNITVAENFSFLAQAPTVRVGAQVNIDSEGTNLVEALFRGDEIDFTSGNNDVVRVNDSDADGAGIQHLRLEPFTVGTDIEIGADTLLAQLNLDDADLNSIGQRVGGAANWDRVFIGRNDGTGIMTFTAPRTFADPVAFLMQGAGGKFAINGVLTNSQPVVDASQPGGTTPYHGFEFLGSGSTTTINANTSTNGTPYAIIDSLEVQANVTLRTDDNGNLASGGAISLGGDVYSQFNETNSLTLRTGNAATTAGVAITGTVGIANPLNDLTLPFVSNVFFNSDIRLAGSLNIDTFNTGSVTFNGDVTVGGTTTITNTGTLSLSNGVDLTSTGAFNQDGAGAVSIGGNLTTTNTNISFSGPITMTGDTTLSAGTGAITLGAASTVNGNFGLVLNSSGVTTIGAAIGATTPIRSLLVNAGGTTTLSGTSITARGNSLTFDDPVTLATSYTFTDPGNVTFNNTLAGGGNDLTMAVAGTTRFVGPVSNIGNAAGLDLTINSTGPTIFESTLTTNSAIRQADEAGTITFRDDVTTGGDTATEFRGNVVLDGLTYDHNANAALTFGNAESDQVTLSNGDVTVDTATNNVALTFNAQVNGSQDLTVNAGTNSITFNASLGQTSRIGDGTGAALTITSATAGVTFLGAVSLASGLSSAADATPVTFNEDVNILAGDTATTINADALRLNGLTFTSAGNVTLGNAATDVLTLDEAQVSINTSAAGTNITVNGLVRSNDDNETTLVANAGNGNVTFGAAIGDAAANTLAALDVDGRNITTANIGAAAVEGVSGSTDLNATGTLTLNGTAYNANAATYTSGLGTTINAAAATTFTSTADAIRFAGGTVTLANGSDLTINSAGGSITTGTIRGNSSEDVTINAGAGAVSVGAIGSANEVNTLAITGSTITLNGNLTTDNQAGNTVTLTGAVHLGTAVTIDTSNNAAGNVSLTSTLDGAHDFRINAGGTVSIAGAIGTGVSTPLTSLTLAGTTINLANIGTTTTAGVTGATSVTATTAINFNGTVYHTNVATYTSPAGNNSNMAAGALTSFITSDDALTFATGNIALANGSDLSINTNGGALSIVAITGNSEEDVTIQSTGGTSNTVSVGAIGTAATDQINDVTITAGTITLSGAINTGGANVGGNVTLTGSVVLGAAIGITTDRAFDGNVVINGTVNGAQALTIDAGADGDVTFAGAVGGSTPLTSVTVSESDNTTAVGVTTTGAQSYTADNGISIRGNFNTTNNNVTLTGSAVTLTGNAAIATGTSAGDITFAADAHVNGTNAGAEALSLNAGMGNITLLNVGATVPFSSVTLLSANNASLTAPVTGGTFRIADLSPDTIAIAENNVLFVSFTNVIGAVTITGDAGDPDSLTYFGTTNNDTVTATGASLVANGQTFTLVNFSGDAAANSLTINTGSGDDTITVTTAADLTYNVNGGEPTASDSLTVNTGGATSNVTASSVTVTGGSTVNYTGIENLNISGGGAVSLTGGAGEDTIAVNPTAATARINSGALINFGATTAITADGAGNANDLAVVNGSASADTIAVVRGATTTVTLAGVTVSVPVATTENLLISSGTGDDTITVTGAGGPALTIDGGLPTASDTLNVSTGAAATVSVTYGTDPSSGVIGDNVAGNVSFLNTEIINLTGSGATSLTINGTTGNDAINQSGNTVTVNNGAVVNFTTYPTLTLNGNNGDDAISVAPTTLVGVTTVNVAGGGSTAGDKVLVNGSGGTDAVAYTPTAINAGTVAITGAPPVSITTTEALSYNGLVGNDTLTVNGTAGNDVVLHTPTVIADAGQVAVNSLLAVDYSNLGATGSVAVNGGAGTDDTLISLGLAFSDTFTITGTASQVVNNRIPLTTTRVENYILSGLAGDDRFNIIPIIDATVDDGTGTVDITVAGDDPGGSDTLNFTVNEADAAPNDIVVELDSNTAGPDVIQTIRQVGLGTVTLSGIETVNIDGDQNNDGTAVNLAVAGTRVDDVITYTPTNTDAGTFTAAGIATVFNFDDVPQATNTFTITGGGGGVLGAGGFADKVIVNGTNGSDRIRVNSLTRNVAVDIQGFGFPPVVLATLRSVTLHDNVAALPAGMTAGIIEAVTVNGRDGGDTFHVVPGAPVGNGLYIDIDGGSPQASDALVITNLDGAGNPTTLAATDFVVVGQSRTPDAGNILVYQSSVRRPNISYTDIEIVTANVPVADPNVSDVNLLILGPDLYESNEFRTTAAFLGSGSNINVDNLAIFPNSSEHVGVPQDTDYFRVVAHTTGTLDVQVYFEDLNGLVPGDGDLNLAVLDSDGTIIAGTGAAATSATFGTDEGAGDSDERIRIPVVQGETYYIRVFGGSVDVVNGYSMTIINDPAPVPYALELQDTPVGDDTLNNLPSNSDTGRSEFDNITRDNTPTLFFRLDDGVLLNDLPGNDATGTPPDQLTSIPFRGTTLLPGYRIAIFDEGNTPSQLATAPQTPLGFATATAQQGVYTFTTPVLADGSHFLTARVQMIDPATPTDTGFGARSLPLEIIVDTVPPPVFFGLSTSATDGLDAASDSGVHAFPATFQDRVTNVETPTFFGTAEADTIIRLYVDNGNGTLQTATDRLLAQVTAVPLDGTNQHPNGRWVATSNVNLNEPALGLGLDGTRRIFVIAEDVAGNVSAPQVLDIFIDTQGPQLFTPAGSANAVFITAFPAYDLFDPKPSLGPTPRTDALTISLRDLPNRDAVNFPGYLAALQAILQTPGHYVLRGDANGVIPIASITATLPAVVTGSPATATVVLTFAAPLPDDRYTLTIEDSITDPAFNALDGESNAREPQETPTFPSGDVSPGGDFVARFTVDSRSEIGAVGQGGAYIDINGNFGFDTTNGDYVNRDLVFEYGINTDGLFAGEFNSPGAVTQDGFDRIGGYGLLNGQFRWLLDFNNDGRPDFSVVSGLQINGTPIAGNFNPAHIGDEIGLFDGVRWYFDTNNNNNIDAGDLTFAGNMRGLPIVGDFDGDGLDDLGVHNAELDLFSFNLTTAGPLDGNADFSIHFNNPAVPLAQSFLLPGVLERPFVGDFNLDGFDDIGLMVPNRNGASPDGTAEFFIFQSIPANASPGTAGALNHQFAPAPLGVDLYAQFGTNLSIPLVGNFDPPVSAVTNTAARNPQLTRLFRSFNFGADGHFFTTSYTEFANTVANGFRDEATGRSGFAVYTQQAAGSTPMFRLFNIQSGAHYYTLNQTERDFLVAINPPPTSGPDTRTFGYRNEGIAGYLFTTQQPSSTLVYRLYNNNSGVHLFTESLAQRNAVLAAFPGIWVEHAPLGFAFPIDANNNLTAGPVSAAARSAPAVAAFSREPSTNLASLIAASPEEHRTSSVTGNLGGELQACINVAANLSTSFSGSGSAVTERTVRVGSGLSDAVEMVADAGLTSDLNAASLNDRRPAAVEPVVPADTAVVDDFFGDQAMLDEMFEEID